MPPYNQELDKVLWESESILYKDGKATLTVQIVSYNGGIPKICVREAGSFMGWQQDENGTNLTKEPKELRTWGRPYIRRMDLNIFKEILPKLITGIRRLDELDYNYKEQKEKKGE